MISELVLFGKQILYRDLQGVDVAKAICFH